MHLMKLVERINTI